MTHVEVHDTAYLETMFGSVPAYSFNMPVRQLSQISYIAIRGKDTEPGRSPTDSEPCGGSAAFGTTFLRGTHFSTPSILNWSEREV